MNNTPRQIANITKTDTHLNVDLRVSVPLSACSEEFVEDVINNKRKMIEGFYDNTVQPAVFVEYLCEPFDIEDGERLRFTMNSRSFKTT